MKARSPSALSFQVSTPPPLPKQLRADPQVAAAAIKSYRAILGAFPKELLADRAFMSSLCERDPLVLDLLRDIEETARSIGKGGEGRNRFPAGRATYKAIAAEHPDWVAEGARFKATLDEAGLTVPDRIGSIETLREVLKNRDQLDLADPRPLAVVMLPEFDPVKAFELYPLDSLTKAYRLVCYQCSNDRSFIEDLERATKDQPASLLVVAGHGRPDAIELGLGDLRNPQHNPGSFLDFGDQEALSALTGAVAPGGHVVLKSCCTGEGRGSLENMANFMGSIFPQANVYAPTEALNNQLVLDERGLFVDPGYWHGTAFTYHVRPSSQPAAPDEPSPA